MTEASGARAPLERTGTQALGVTVAGLVAAGLMIVVDFLPIVSVDVAGGSCEVINDSSPALADGCVQSGFERHGPALLLLGLVTAAMAWGAGRGGSRPAAVALVALGLLVLCHRPADRSADNRRHRSHRVPLRGAHAQAEIGFTLELAAGALAALAGAARLLLSSPWR
jgi:hypothetical protein